MPDTPLNPDALEAAADAVVDASFGQELPEAPIDLATAAVSAYLAVAQPEVNSVEEADQLPAGSMILSGGSARLRTDWGSGWASGLAGDDYPTDFPAGVLYRPEVKP